MRFGILLILLGPVVLLALVAAFLLLTRRTRPTTDDGRSDATEPKPLTGTEQQKHRPEHGWQPRPQ